MIIQKKLAKIKHYWLTDYQFRRAIWNNCFECEYCPSNFISYSDFRSDYDSAYKMYDSFSSGLRNYVDQFYSRNEFYFLGLSLGVNGLIFLIRTSENQELLRNLDVAQKRAFLAGKNGLAEAENLSQKEKIFYLGGYDIYLEKNENK